MRKDVKEYELLSAYLDGELSDVEKEQLEQKIKSSLKLQKKLEDLQKIKKLTTTSYSKLPESPFFETRLFAEIDSQKPLRKKLWRWSPAIGIVVVTIAIMLVLKFNPDMINNLIEQQKTTIAGFYKENLRPLLFASDINNEDIFNFAMYKQLPLDKKNKQLLQLGYDPSGREYFEIKNDNPKSGENNFEKFILALELNEAQKKQIDSIINQYAEELEGQILVNENNTVAINSNLWNYQRAIQSDLLAFAENSNKNNFHRFAPATVSLSQSPHIIREVNKLRTTRNKNYIILTPDSIFSEPIEFDVEKFKVKMKELETNLQDKNNKLRTISIQLKYDSSWRKGKDKYTWQGDFNITIDSNLCRIQIPKFDIPDIRLPDFDSLFGVFDSVASNFRFYSRYIPRVEYYDNKMKFHFDGDSAKTYEFEYFDFNFDSMMRSQNKLMDSLNKFYWKDFHQFNDSLVFKSIPRLDHYFRFYNNEDDIQKQMEELKRELQKFREEMQDWRKDFKKESKTTQKKYYD